jgi:hypothetical protein
MKKKKAYYLKLSLKKEIVKFTLRTPKKACILQTWKGSIRKFHTDLGSIAAHRLHTVYGTARHQG